MIELVCDSSRNPKHTYVLILLILFLLNTGFRMIYEERMNCKDPESQEVHFRNSVGFCWRMMDVEMHYCSHCPQKFTSTRSLPFKDFFVHADPTKRLHIKDTKKLLTSVAG